MSATGYFQYNLRTVIHSGVGSVIRIPALLQGLGAKRVLLISDQGLKAAGVVDQVSATFNMPQSGNMPVLAAIYTDILPDAGSSNINDCLRFAREHAIDSILAVGGGSVLDAAKAVKYGLCHQLLDIADTLQSGIKIDSWPQAQHMGIPHVAVPTTAGTGAEVSPAAVILNEAANFKGGLVAPFIDADIAVLDAQLTLGLPPSLTASTGMDALTHALEAIASPNANPFSDSRGFMAAQLIEEYLPQAVANGQDLVARSQMINASCMAIDAYVGALNATPVHNCSHAFGALYHIPHGDGNAVLLPIVMEEIPELYVLQAQRLAKALNMPAAEKSGEALLADIIARLRDFQQQIGCLQDFSRWQIRLADMEKIQRAVAGDPMGVFFPIPPDKVERIARKAIGQ